MKILVFTRYGRLGASSRVRMLQFIPCLQQNGIQFCVSPLLSDAYVQGLYQGKGRLWWEVLKAYVKRLYALRMVFRYDALWIEKELFPGLPATVERLLNLFGVRYVADYDDAVFHNYDLLGNRISRLLLRDKIAVVMRCANRVCVGNAYLEAYARKAGSRDVQIIPSVVDTERYRPRMAAVANCIPVVGWMGTPPTVKYLKTIAPALVEIQQRIPFLLRVVGAEFQYPGLHVECLSWSEENEVELIQGFDVGIMPLDDTPWEKGKCGYKLIQYMACGVPVIGSLVGVNAEIIDEGVGSTAVNDEDWRLNLNKYLADPMWRQNAGIHGRIRVERIYCVKIITKQLLKLFVAISEAKN